jgi:hypothetical protein
MSYYSKFMVKYNDMLEAVVEINLSSDQITRISKIMMENYECRSPYCECEKGKCSSGKIDKRGETLERQNKDPRQFSVIPRSLSSQAIRQIAEQVRARNRDLLEDNISDAFELIVANYAVAVQPGSIATVPYAESTLKTRRKWIDFCIDIQRSYSNLTIGRRARSIANEIERSIQFGRPINYSNDMLAKPCSEPKSQVEKWEEILCKYIDQ